jgi:hypothetical protein
MICRWPDTTAGSRSSDHDPALARFEDSGVKMHHGVSLVPRQISEIGRIRLWKLIEGLKIITFVMATRLRPGARVLYYPPAGPHITAVLRDLVILISTR